MHPAEGTSGPWAVGLRAEAPGWTGAFLRETAAALASAPRRSAFLIDQSPDTGSVVLRLPDGRLRPLIEQASARIPGIVGLAPGGPPSPTTEGTPTVYLVAVPTGDPEPRDPRPSGRPGESSARDPPRRTPPIPIVPFGPVPRLDPVRGIRVDSQSLWESRGDGRLSVRLRSRVLASRAQLARELPRFAVGLLRRLVDAGLPPARLQMSSPHPSREARWTRGPGRWVHPGAPFVVRPDEAAREVSLPSVPAFPTSDDLLHHAVAIGASGSGKTAWLVEVARRAVERGTSTFVVDVHGDVGPRLAARLSPVGRARLVVLDPTDERAPRTGVRVLGGTGIAPEVEAAHLVAALKRLTGEGGETYWGFRMERVFDTFVRRVQEEGGTLVDLFDLLTDASRRDAARLATRVPAVARFLEELPAIQHRNPEYLAPAASRIAKVLLRPELTRLLAPVDSGLPVDTLLDDGRSLVVRLPLGSLGPEASGFASTLLVSRLYLGRTTRPSVGAAALRTLFVVDEASNVSPRILAEILAEGRKFGVGLLIATQYPERFAMELRSAATGAAGSHVAFRVPMASAATTGGWVGLTAGESAELLPSLPTGTAIVASRFRPVARMAVVPAPPPSPDPDAWAGVLQTSTAEFPGSVETDQDDGPEIDEELLFAILGLESRRTPAETPSLHRWLTEVSTAGIDPATIPGRLPVLERRGWISGSGSGPFHLTAAGRRYLGCDGRTGATRESAEHRALLIGAFRRLAARGCRLEILRQGRFDTRLPDARLCLLPPEPEGGGLPLARAELLDRARSGWAWRFFDGHNAFFEAEVSGATRRDRIRHDVAKAQKAQAFLVVLVADPRRAAFVRRVLDELVDPPRGAQVWTLPEAAGVRPSSGFASG